MSLATLVGASTVRMLKIVAATIIGLCLLLVFLGCTQFIYNAVYFRFHNPPAEKPKRLPKKAEQPKPETEPEPEPELKLFETTDTIWRGERPVKVGHLPLNPYT